MPPPWGQGPCLPLAHPPYLPGQPPRWRLGGLERIPNKKNSASRFSLPRCQMTRALHHPRQKSSCEGGGGHQPRSKPSLVPVSSLFPFLPGPPHSHSPRPMAERQASFPSASLGEPRRPQDSSSKRVFLAPRIKAAAAQTEAKFLYTLAPGLMLGCGFYEEH